MIAFAMMLAEPELTQDQVVDGWLISKGDTYCSMSSLFEGGTFVRFSEEWRTNRIGLDLANEGWKSLGARAGQTVKVEFKLSGKLVEYDQWWDETAQIMADPDKNLYAISAWWDGNKHDDDFWANWALATGAEVSIDGKRVGNFSMAGTYKAMLALARCSALGLRDDKSDPFAE